MANVYRTWALIILLAAGSQAQGQTIEKKESKPPSQKVIGDTDTAFDDEDGGSGGGEVEALYDKHEESESKKRTMAKPREAKPELKDATTLSELANLAPFSDVAVIQRRFLPRTGRFEFSANGMTSINNPFFSNLGVNLRGAYFFQEKHGIELQYSLMSKSRRSVTANLEDQRDVRTTNLVTAKSYMGAAYKWIPLFGKITFLNAHIVPFDLSFTGGFGLSKTDKKNEPTVHLGTGQTFALTKSFAVRWDVVWNYYQATADSATGVGETKTNHNDLFLSFGASFFIPEAKYR
ncbi:MAG: outer membrane beta-barrel domain-containing protein [Bdellovibrionales bacterium]